MKPAARAISSAVVADSPSVPRPAPSGDDIADDMQDSTLMPYMSEAMGFLVAFKAKVSCALMSTSSQTPSSASDA